MFAPRSGGRGTDPLTPTRVYTNPLISNLVLLCHHHHANNDDSRRRGWYMCIADDGRIGCADPADASSPTEAPSPTNPTAPNSTAKPKPAASSTPDNTPPWDRNNGTVSPRETVNKINTDQCWHKHTQTQQHSSHQHGGHTDDAAGPADGNSAYAGHYQHYMPPSM